MEWRVIVFGIVCVGILACMWRGGPCSVFFHRCKEQLLKKPPEAINEATVHPTFTKRIENLKPPSQSAAPITSK
jgi:hypothetical protein